MEPFYKQGDRAAADMSAIERLAEISSWLRDPDRSSLLKEWACGEYPRMLELADVGTWQTGPTVQSLATHLASVAKARDEALALVTEWQTSFESMNKLRHKVMQERDYWRQLCENTAEALRKTQDALVAKADKVDEQARIIAVLQEAVGRAADQDWYWSKEWQDAEREADENLRNGEYEVFGTVDDLLASWLGLGDAEED